MMHEILAYIGFYTDNAFPHVQGFWSTYLGLFISGSLCFCAAVNVMHPDIDDDCFDRVWYSVLCILMLIAFMLGISPGTDPHHVVQTLLIMLMIRAWHLIFRKLHFFWYK